VQGEAARSARCVEAHRAHRKRRRQDAEGWPLVEAGRRD